MPDIGARRPGFANRVGVLQGGLTPWVMNVPVMVAAHQAKLRFSLTAERGERPGDVAQAGADGGAGGDGGGRTLVLVEGP